MKTWITTLGWSHYAVLNTLWASVSEKKWVPDRIYILTNEQTKKGVLELSTKMEKIILHNGGNKVDFRIRMFDEGDLEALFKLYKEIIRTETKEGNRITIDITPGRKFMSAFSLYCALNDKSNIDNIFYCHVLDDEFLNNPYPFIPVNAFALRNLKDYDEVSR